MPVLRNIEVHVTDAYDVPLKEWGARKLERARLTTCYIQSETNKAFRISLRPAVLPFPDFEDVVIKIESDDESSMGALPQYDGAGDEGDVMAKVRARAMQVDGRGMVYDPNTNIPSELKFIAKARDVHQGRGKSDLYVALAPDACDWFARLHINDYPQKARWAVTNRTNVARILEKTGASLTVKGVHYADEDAIPLGDDPPKLYLLIEASTKQAVEEAAEDVIELLEATTGAAGYYYEAGPKAAHGYRGANRVAPLDGKGKPSRTRRSRKPLLSFADEMEDARQEQSDTLFGYRNQRSPPPPSSESASGYTSISAHARQTAQPAPPRQSPTYSSGEDSRYQPDQIDKIRSRYGLGNRIDNVYRSDEFSYGDGPSRYNDRRDRRNARPSPLTRTSYHDRPLSPAPPPPADWHLLATLRLDGRTGFEKRCIVYLDERHSSFKLYDGMVYMRSRNVQDEDGGLRECGWYFRDVGIETVFDKLFLSGGAGEGEAVPAKDEDDLLAAFSSLGASGFEDAEEEIQAGQIEITLERVRVGETRNGVRFQPPSGQDIDMDSPDLSKLSHTAARDAGRRRANRIDLVYYEPFTPGGEKPYATFRFYYRSEEKLRKFNFPGFPPSATDRKKRNRQEALTQASMQPLSIVKREPDQYIFNDQGDIIGVIDAPKASPVRSSHKLSDTDKEAAKAWKPSSSSLKPVISLDSPENSPPGSPKHDSRSASMDESDGEDTETAENNYLTAKAKAIMELTASDAEQSSADESSPLKRHLPQERKDASSHLQAFRNIETDDVAAEEADDEASDGARTPNSMTFRDDVGDEDGDDSGISLNKDDQGLGKRLGKIQLGKRYGETEDEESAETNAKKARTDVAVNLAKEEDVGVDTTQAEESIAGEGSPSAY